MGRYAHCREPGCRQSAAGVGMLYCSTHRRPPKEETVVDRPKHYRWVCLLCSDSEYFWMRDADLKRCIEAALRCRSCHRATICYEYVGTQGAGEPLNVQGGKNEGRAA